MIVMMGEPVVIVGRLTVTANCHLTLLQLMLAIARTLERVLRLMRQDGTTDCQPILLELDLEQTVLKGL